MFMRAVRLFGQSFLYVQTFKVKTSVKQERSKRSPHRGNEDLREAGKE